MKLRRKDKTPAQNKPASGRRRRFSRSKLLFGLLLLVPVLAFVMQNSTPVTVRFFQWQYPVSLALLLFSVLLGGVLLGLLLVYSRRAVRRKKEPAERRSVPPASTADRPAETPAAEEPDTAPDSEPLPGEVAAAQATHDLKPFPAPGSVSGEEGPQGPDGDESDDKGGTR